MKFQFNLCMIFLLLAGAGIAAQLTPIALHPNFGTILSRHENNRYEIFGPAENFNMAKLYQQNPSTYQLHIVYHVKGQPQMLLIKLSQNEYKSMTRQIESRLADVNYQPSGIFLYNIQPKDLKAVKTYKVVTDDQGLDYGHIYQTQQDDFYIKTFDGNLWKIPESDIVELASLYKKPREHWENRYHPAHSRMYFTPTGKGLYQGSYTMAVQTKGDGYIAAGYGITDYLNVYGGGRVFTEDKEPFYYVNPHISLPLTRGVHVSGGMYFLDGEDYDNSASRWYGMLSGTYKGLQLNLGVASLHYREDREVPSLIVGGGVQLNRNTWYVTENWFYLGPQTSNLFMHGIRCFFNNNAMLDLAVVSSNINGDRRHYESAIWVGIHVFLGYWLRPAF